MSFIFATDPPDNKILPIKVIIPTRSVSYKAILMFSLILGPTKTDLPLVLFHKVKIILKKMFKFTQIPNNSSGYPTTWYSSTMPMGLSPLMWSDLVQNWNFEISTSIWPTFHNKTCTQSTSSYMEDDLVSFYVLYGLTIWWTIEVKMTMNRQISLVCSDTIIIGY